MLGKIKILLVEDSNFDAKIIMDMLKRNEQDEVAKLEYHITRAINLSDALSKLQNDYFDIILLDLTLPDSMGLNTIESIHSRYFESPIIVLTGISDQSLAINSVKSGAQDYLVKGNFDSNLLMRSIYYSIERHKMVLALRGMALIDQLTGLYNRHGFLTLAKHHIKLAQRRKNYLLMLYCDMDYLKYINDNFGHKAGDKALVEVARILQDTFRESDIIGRLGGDEFVILSINIDKNDVETLLNRLYKNIDEYNKFKNREYDLSLSIGTALYDPYSNATIDDLLDISDNLMYEDKKKKRRNF